MDETKSPELQAQLEAVAMNNPHQLYLADRILKINVGAFLSHITFGNTAANGQIMAVATVTTSTNDLHNMASAILEAIAKNAPQIRAEQATFTKKLPKT